MLFGLAFGTKIVSFCLWAVTSVSMPESWQKAVMQGSAAIVNILIGFVAAFVFARVSTWITKTFAYYVAGFSWFSGFGYLFIDSITAGPNTHGDWGKVIMMLGGSWTVRIPILGVGAVGYAWTIYWLARGTRDIASAMNESVGRRILVLLIAPYFVVNILFTFLSFWHPVPDLRLKVALNCCWLGNFGYFAAAVGAFFQWASIRSVDSDEVVRIPDSLSGTSIAIATGMYCVAAFFAIPRPVNLELW